MHLKFLAVLGVGALMFVAAPRAAAAGCCDQGGDMKCCQHDMKNMQHDMKDMACCDKTEKKDMACCDKKVDVVDVLLALSPESNLQLDPQINPAPPVRQTAEVWLMRPTVVGRTILQGRYVIEHDNDRMARGEPCTHIYAFNDRTKPVATFHCVHLERGRAAQNVVVLATNGQGWQDLTEFQFAGETAAHGYPSGR